MCVQQIEEWKRETVLVPMDLGAVDSELLQVAERAEDERDWKDRRSQM